MTHGAWKGPSNIATTGVSVITTEGENSADDKSTTNLPAVLAGMERHEALAFVSQLYDHAKAGRSVWGDKLLLRKFIGQCSRTNSAETRNRYARELRNLCQWRDKNYSDLMLRQIDPNLMQQCVDDLRLVLMPVDSNQTATTAGSRRYQHFIAGPLNQRVARQLVFQGIQCQRDACCTR